MWPETSVGEVSLLVVIVGLGRSWRNSLLCAKAAAQDAGVLTMVTELNTLTGS